MENVSFLSGLSDAVFDITFFHNLPVPYTRTQTGEVFMMNRLSSISALALTSLFVAGSALGQVTTKTTAGTYSVICEGYLTFPNPFPPASNPPSVQFASAKALGTATADMNGHFTGSTTLSVGGFAVVTQTVSGTETVNPAGTGTITYSTTIDGAPGPPLNISFVVSKHGDRIDGLSTDPGTVFACVLRRISTNDVAVGPQKPGPSPQHVVPARQAKPSNTAELTTARRKL
jgi:hypothetical protein